MNLDKIAYAIIIDVLRQSSPTTDLLLQQCPALQQCLPVKPQDVNWLKQVIMTVKNNCPATATVQALLIKEPTLQATIDTEWTNYQAAVSGKPIPPKAMAAQPYQPPSLFDKARNLSGAAGRTIKAALQGEVILVSQEEQARRLSICQGTDTTKPCEFYDDGVCGKCGCILRFKKTLAKEHCPISRW